MRNEQPTNQPNEIDFPIEVLQAMILDPKQVKTAIIWANKDLYNQKLSQETAAKYIDLAENAMAKFERENPGSTAHYQIDNQNLIEKAELLNK